MGAMKVLICRQHPKLLNSFYKPKSFLLRILMEIPTTSFMLSLELVVISFNIKQAKITSIQINDETNKAEVYLHPDQVSLAIGKGGFNIRLASMLTRREGRPCQDYTLMPKATQCPYQHLSIIPLP